MGNLVDESKSPYTENTKEGILRQFFSLLHAKSFAVHFLYDWRTVDELLTKAIEEGQERYKNGQMVGVPWVLGIRDLCYGVKTTRVIHNTGIKGNLRLDALDHLYMSLFPALDEATKKKTDTISTDTKKE